MCFKLVCKEFLVFFYVIENYCNVMNVQVNLFEILYFNTSQCFSRSSITTMYCTITDKTTHLKCAMISVRRFFLLDTIFRSSCLSLSYDDSYKIGQFKSPFDLVFLSLKRNKHKSLERDKAHQGSFCYFIFTAFFISSII